MRVTDFSSGFKPACIDEGSLFVDGKLQKWRQTVERAGFFLHVHTQVYSDYTSPGSALPN